MTQYLLGTLSEDDRVRLEERYFSDDSLFEEIEIAEEELIDKYVRGELSTSDADRFAATVAGSSRIAERVDFARVWKNKLASTSLTSPITQREAVRDPVSWWQKFFGPTESRTPRLAYAVVALILLVGSVALLAGWLRIREQSRQLAAQQAALEQRQRELDRQAADLKNQLEELAKGSTQPTPTETPNQVDVPTPEGERTIVALMLSPGATRGQGSGNTIRITPGTQQVRITLNVRDTDYSSYEAIIKTPDLTTVFASGPLRLNRSGSRASIVLSVPANKLPPGVYPVIVSGRTPAGTSETVHDYQFRVIR